MLNKYDQKNIAAIKSMAQKVFGQNCTLGEIQLLDRPFTEFEWTMKLYDRFEVLITYDRSIIGINVKVNGDFINLRKLTSKEIKKGFDSSKQENIFYNFKLLDEVLKDMEKRVGRF